MPHARALSFWISRRSDFTSSGSCDCIWSSSANPRIAWRGLLISCATPDTSWPTAASRSWRMTWRCSDCTSSRMPRSSAACASSAVRVSLKRRTIWSNASCSSANSCVAIGLRSSGPEVAGRDALGGGVEVRDRLAEPARQHDRDDQPSGKAEREHGERPRPERQRPVERDVARECRRSAATACPRSERSRRPGGHRRSSRALRLAPLRSTATATSARRSARPRRSARAGGRSASLIDTMEPSGRGTAT